MLQSVRPSTSAALDTGLHLEVFEGADALALAQMDWLALERRGGAPTVFQSYALASACAVAHLRREEVPRIVVGRRAGVAVAIVPLVVTRWFGARVLRFLGDPLIQYGDALAVADATDAEIAAVWERALACDAAAALLRRVRADARGAPYLSVHARDVAGQETALVDLTQSSMLSHRNAREIRRLQRRLADRGTVTLQVQTGPDAVPMLTRVLHLKRAWMKQNGLASMVLGDGDWESTLTELCRAGALRIATLEVGGDLAAAELAFCDPSCWYGFLGVFDQRFAKMGPGHVLTAACIDMARAQRLVCYDQLPPAQSYKREQATHILAVRDYVLPFTAQGRLLAAAAGLLPDLKSAFASLPPALRQMILSRINH